MLDFLTFKTFISPSVLIVFYYIGAILVPLVSFFGARKVKNKYFASFPLSLSLKHSLIIIGTFVFSFMMMELLWRMMFEVLIAYFDMHDALMGRVRY